MSEETRQRRRTVLIYKAPSSDTAYALAEPVAEGLSSTSSPSIQATKEKLSRFKNLIYSPREAELLGDLAQFLIGNEPAYGNHHKAFSKNDPQVTLTPQATKSILCQHHFIYKPAMQAWAFGGFLKNGWVDLPPQKSA